MRMAGELYGGIRRLFLGNRPKDDLADTVTVQNQGLDQAFLLIVDDHLGRIDLQQAAQTAGEKDHLGGADAFADALLGGGTDGVQIVKLSHGFFENCPQQWLLDFHKSILFKILTLRLGLIKMLKISEKSSPEKTNHRTYYK